LIITCSQALPGNADPEAQPPIFPSLFEAEPLDIGSQAEHGNQRLKAGAGLQIFPFLFNILANPPLQESWLIDQT